MGLNQKPVHMQYRHNFSHIFSPEQVEFMATEPVDTKGLLYLYPSAQSAANIKNQ